VSPDLQAKARRRSSQSVGTRLGGGLILAALVPGVFGLALLSSAVIGRPLLARAVVTSDRGAAANVTIAWGIGLIAIAAGQLAGALAGFGSIAARAAANHDALVAVVAIRAGLR
jgi:hypothetical protein